MKMLHGLCVVLLMMSGLASAMGGGDLADWDVVTSAKEDRDKLEKASNKKDDEATIKKHEDGLLVGPAQQDYDGKQQTNEEQMDEYLTSLRPDLKKLAATIADRVPLLSSCFSSGDVSDDDGD